jgi:uncharacterized membrane protein
MDWIDLKTIYTILHVFGAVIGAGGAYVSDAMFFSSVKDQIISKVELRFMKIGSTFVWIGLALLFVSGLLLFSTNPAGYLESSKFLIKMLIVFVIFLNGLVFHLTHLPRMHRHAGHHLPSSDEFTRKEKLLVASGIVSVTSWTFALILGGLRTIPIDFTTALIAYVVFEIVAVSVGLLLSKKILKIS